MKNSECVIYAVGRSGKVYQTFRKEKKGWTLTSGNGTVRRCSAEQVLSHILPPLAGVSPAFIRVERIEEEETVQGKNAAWMIRARMARQSP